MLKLLSPFKNKLDQMQNSERSESMSDSEKSKEYMEKMKKHLDSISGSVVYCET